MEGYQPEGHNALHAAAPGAEYLLVAHAAHALMAVDPAVPTNVPAGHAVQVVPDRYQPAGHVAAHDVAPREEDVPVPHAVQDDALAPLYVPAAHCFGSMEPDGQNDPAGHAEQVVAVADERYDPAAHCEQDEIVGLG